MIPGPEPSSDATWVFGLATRLVVGAGAVARLGELALELGAARVLVVTDPGVAAAGHASVVESVLERAGLACTRYEGVHENPTTDDVESCLVALRVCAPDLVVALGGGSSIDAAKGALLVAAGGGSVGDYWIARPGGARRPARPLLPLIAVPTTAGTGSEVQSFALLADSTSHAKMACGHRGLAPRVAVLDPNLTATQPQRVAACTGLDALTHAVEAAVSRSASSLSRLCAREAFARCLRHLPAVLSGHARSEDREGMLLAAALAGVAIENGMLGAAHSMANPLTAHHGVAHGQAVAMALPHVVRFNAAEPGAARVYQQLALAGGLVPSDATLGEAARRLALCVEGLLDLAGFPRGLAALGVEADALPGLAAEAETQWTAAFNPRAVGRTELLELYRAALAP